MSSKRDVSTSVSSSFGRHFFVSVLGNAPYGYDRVKNDNGYQLVIDEPFCEWQHGTISNMLSNEVYIGTLYQGKTKTNLCTGEKKHRIDKENWIIHEEAHEPIVSKELFMEVRSIVEKRRDKMSCTFREDLPLTEDKYKGILKCPVCGDFVHRESSIVHTEQGDVRKYYYRCRHNSLLATEREGMVGISEKQFANALLSVKDVSVLTAELVKVLIAEIVLNEDRCRTMIFYLTQMHGSGWRSI